MKPSTASLGVPAQPLQEVRAVVDHSALTTVSTPRVAPDGLELDHAADQSQSEPASPSIGSRSVVRSRSISAWTWVSSLAKIVVNAPRLPVTPDKPRARLVRSAGLVGPSACQAENLIVVGR